MVGTPVAHEVGDHHDSTALVLDLDEVIGLARPVVEGGVEAGPPVDGVAAVAAPDEVIAALAVDLVIALLAVEVVGGSMDVGVEGEAIPAENTIVAATAPDLVRSRLAEEQIRAATALDVVAAVVAVYLVIVIAPMEVVAAATSVNDVGAALAVDVVVAIVAKKKVYTAAAVDPVDVVSALDPVMTIPAENLVSATAAVDGVVSISPIDRVVAAVSVNQVVAPAAVDLVVAAVAVDLVVAPARVDRVGPDAAEHEVVAAVGLDQRALRQRAEARRTEDIDGVAAGKNAREEFVPTGPIRLVDVGGRKRAADDGIDRAERIEARAVDDCRHRAADRNALAEGDVGAEEEGPGAADVLEGEAAEAAGHRAQRNRDQCGIPVDDVLPERNEEALLVVSHGRHCESPMRAPFVRRRVGVGPGACDRGGAMRGQHAPRGAHAGSARNGSLAWEFCELAHSRAL